MNKDWILWQIIDSAFPNGAFVHSGGLEAAVQHRVVRDSDTLMEFARVAVRQTQCGILRYVEQAWQDLSALSAIDADCDLFLNNAIANRASRAQGRAFLSTAQRVFDAPQIQLQGTDPGHLAPVFGAICRNLDLDESPTRAAFLFMTARGCFSSAVRLGVVGPIEAQQIQRRLSEEIRPVSGDGPAVQIAPLLDLVQGAQDRLYSRLFQS